MTITDENAVNEAVAQAYDRGYLAALRQKEVERWQTATMPSVVRLCDDLRRSRNVSSDVRREDDLARETFEQRYQRTRSSETT